MFENFLSNFILSIHKRINRLNIPCIKVPLRVIISALKEWCLFNFSSICKNMMLPNAQKPMNAFFLHQILVLIQHIQIEVCQLLKQHFWKLFLQTFLLALTLLYQFLRYIHLSLIKDLDCCTYWISFDDCLKTYVLYLLSLDVLELLVNLELSIVNFIYSLLKLQEESFSKVLLLLPFPISFTSIHQSRPHHFMCIFFIHLVQPLLLLLHFCSFLNNLISNLFLNKFQSSGLHFLP